MRVLPSNPRSSIITPPTSIRDAARADVIKDNKLKTINFQYQERTRRGIKPNPKKKKKKTIMRKKEKQIGPDKRHEHRETPKTRTIDPGSSLFSRYDLFFRTGRIAQAFFAGATSSRSHPVGLTQSSPFTGLGPSPFHTAL